MKISALFQFILGFILGVAILAVGATALALLFFGRMASSPPKPVFSEEKQEETKVAENKKSSTSDQPSSDQADTVEEESEKVEKKKEEKPAEKPAEKLPPGAYKAKVTWSEGLSLRSEPTPEAERIGGVGYNSELIILEQSSDQKWQKVRIANSNQEGWIKAGNIEKVEEGNEVEN